MLWISIAYVLSNFYVAFETTLKPPFYVLWNHHFPGDDIKLSTVGGQAFLASEFLRTNPGGPRMWYLHCEQVLRHLISAPLCSSQEKILLSISEIDPSLLVSPFSFGYLFIVAVHIHSVICSKNVLRTYHMPSTWYMLGIVQGRWWQFPQIQVRRHTCKVL